MMCINYKRQLNYYLFNIHLLSNADSVFYVYDETIGKKGADDVVSHLFDFVFNILSYRYIRSWLYFVIHVEDKIKTTQYSDFSIILYMHIFALIKIDFVSPICGHSYMECDRNLAFINQKTKIQLPSEWASHIIDSRKSNNDFKSWTNFLKPFYKMKCPFPSRPIQKFGVSNKYERLIFRIIISVDHGNLLLLIHSNWNCWESTTVMS